MKSGRVLSLLAPIALMAAACLANTALAVELTNGQRITIEVPQDGAVTDLFIDVPPGTESMRVELTNGAGNLDLFAREDEPFTTKGKGENIADFLRTQATYISFGPPPNPDEFVIITDRMMPPLTPGTWYFAVSNMNIEDTSVRIEVNFDDVPLSPPAPLILVSADGGGEGFSDPGPWFGLGGNEADTLGEARRNAFERAMDILAATLDSPVPIYVVADWRTDMGENTLASAGPDYLFHDTQGLPLTDTWYAGPPAVRLGGTEACRLGDRDPCLNLPEKGGIPFSGDISVSINATQTWYLGFDPDLNPDGQFDFIDVIMHEVLHGLGIITFMDRENGLFLNGETLGFDENGIPDIYAVNLESVLNGNFVDITSGQRADAIVSGGFLHFSGPFTTTSPANIFADQAGDGHIQLHAPPNLQLGSSTSHIHQAFGINEIMTPTASSTAPTVGAPGIAMDMLWDLGWAPQEGQEAPLVAFGMGYDRSRSGHGYDFQKVGDLFFLVFYTYEGVAAQKGVANAVPTWYLAVGTIKDGVFTTDASGLQRFTYDPQDNPPQSLDPTFEGDVSLTFGVDSDHPNCDDGVNRNSALSLAAFDWTIGADSGSWCTEPLVIYDGSPAVNPTGHWFAGAADQGWGMTAYFQGDGVAQEKGTSTLEFLVLYFYDALGLPTWTLGVKEPAALTNTVNMDSFLGYPPAANPVGVTTTPAGTIAHVFANQIMGTADIDVTAPNAPWTRDTDITQLSNQAE